MIALRTSYYWRNVYHFLLWEHQEMISNTWWVHRRWRTPCSRFLKKNKKEYEDNLIYGNLPTARNSALQLFYLLVRHFLTFSLSIYVIHFISLLNYEMQLIIENAPLFSDVALRHWPDKSGSVIVCKQQQQMAEMPETTERVKAAPVGSNWLLGCRGSS